MHSKTGLSFYCFLTPFSFFSLLTLVRGQDVCHELTIDSSGLDLSFDSSITLNLQQGMVNARSWFSGAGYSLQWNENDLNECEVVRVSGCEALVFCSMTTYERQGTCDGRPMYLSSIGGYLYYSAAFGDWNISD